MTQRQDRDLLAEGLVESVRDIGQVLQDLSNEAWLSAFVTSYSGVLIRAEELSYEIAGRLSSLIAGFQSGTISSATALRDYVDAMSFDLDGRAVFLPSYSDTCFRDLAKVSPLRLSPFRGIYYSWQLAEISKEFVSGRFASGSKYLNLLQDELAVDHAIQSSSSPRYRDYYELLGRLSDLGSRPGQLDAADRLQVEALRNHVVCLKQAFLNVTAAAKARWILRLPYPVLTSTHFYLSGLRFFWNPVLSRNFDPDGARYYVQSRTSGLIIPKERYGMLLPNGDNDSAANDLIQAIPPGRLAVDMRELNQATEWDLANLLVFERWSHRITSAAYHLASETLEMITDSPTGIDVRNLACANFIHAVRENPMRALYFDMGIYGILRRADMPSIQYSMTRDTHIGPPRAENPGRKMFESLSEAIDTGRLQLYRFISKDWPDSDLSEWTLIPSRHNLSHVTCGIWSERRNRKIATGKEAKLWQVLLGNAVGSVNWTEQAVLATVGLPFGVIANLTPELIPIICTLCGFLVAPSYASYTSLRERLKIMELIEGIPHRVGRDVRTEREPNSFLEDSL